MLRCNLKKKWSHNYTLTFKTVLDDSLQTFVSFSFSKLLNEMYVKKNHQLQSSLSTCRRIGSRSPMHTQIHGVLQSCGTCVQEKSALRVLRFHIQEYCIFNPHLVGTNNSSISRPMQFKPLLLKVNCVLSLEALCGISGVLRIYVQPSLL